MKKLFFIVLAALATTPALAADIAAGKAKTAVCASCHGPDGKAVIPTYPNLHGQNAAYLEKQLKAFKSGDRVDPVMKPMASMLSDNDIKNVAAYYQSLK